MADVLESKVLQEAGEWLDKESRKDGKPRRWKPGKPLPLIDPSRLIKQTQEDIPAHPPENILFQDRIGKK